MNLSDKSRAEALPVYEKILKHPFVKELMDGTLAKERFTFYIEQDALYLADYGRVLAGVAARLDNSAHRESFLGFSKDTMFVEQALHNSFLNGSAREIQQSPACALYTSYLLKQLAVESVEVCVAAVLPCFWIYKEVGDYILAHQTSTDNPYQAWIDTYGGEEYAAAVRRAIDIHDELAESVSDAHRERMTQAFIMASKMEWMFWDSAYKVEGWPV